MCQCEDTEAVKKALEIFTSWNNSWTPKYAMVDSNEEKITALEDVFPVRVRFCSVFDLSKYSQGDIKLCSRFHHRVELEAFNTVQAYFCNEITVQLNNMLTLNDRLQFSIFLHLFA